jgi:NAD(P)-dependent dehydrogenase (short-subunit alcohol dehydrogenase family)
MLSPMDSTGFPAEATPSSDPRTVRELRGRVAVVTGAASGIGLGLATRFAAEGMRVVLADVDEVRLARARRGLAEGGAEVVSVPCDVSLPDQVDALAREVVSTFGAVHVVCNNAGVAGTAGMLWELEPEDWSRILGVNLLGVVNGVRAFVPLLLEQGEGHVVNTASMAGLVSGVLGAYSVTKHAVVALSEALYYDLAATGSAVGVSVLCPGWVRTNIASSQRQPRGARWDPQRAAMGQLLARQIAAGMDPAEVAGFVVEAIQTGRFYVITDSDRWAEGVKTRFGDILAGRRPTLPSIV